MVMTALREGASGGILKYFLLGILAMAAGGLIFMDMGGFFRGGVTSTDAAKAGKHTISIQYFDRTVRSTLSRLGLSTEQAWKVGYIRELLASEIQTSLLAQEAQDKGVLVSNKLVASHIQKLIRPMAQPGQSPADVLQQILRAQGMSEQQLANSIRREMTVNTLGNAVQSGVLETSDLIVKDLAVHKGETRNVSYVLFKNVDLKDIQKPSEEQLQQFYEATKETFAVPETRKSKIILIDSETIKASLEITDEEIQDIYERNVSAYTEPEKREIEQVILSDADMAQQVYEAAQDGKSLKDALQSVADNTTDFLPAKKVAEAELFDELRDPVFDAQAGALLEPIETALGTHVVFVKTIQEKRTTPLSEVKNDIRADLQETRLLDAQYDLANSVDDYFAAGEPIDSIKDELPVDVQDFPPSNNFGIGADGKAVFTGAFGPDAQTLVEFLFELGEEEASSIIELADGRMAAIYAEEIKEKTYTPFEDVRDNMEKRWIEDTRRVQNQTHVKAILEMAQQQGGIGLKAIANDNGKSVANLNALKRGQEAKAPLTQIALNSIFEAPKGEMFMIDLKDGPALASVTAISTPDSPSQESLTSVRNELQQAKQNEAYALYVGKLREEYGVTINQRLLEQAYGGQEAP